MHLVDFEGKSWVQAARACQSLGVSSKCIRYILCAAVAVEVCLYLLPQDRDGPQAACATDMQVAASDLDMPPKQAPRLPIISVCIVMVCRMC